MEIKKLIEKHIVNNDMELKKVNEIDVMVLNEYL